MFKTVYQYTACEFHWHITYSTTNNSEHKTYISHFNWPPLKIHVRMRVYMWVCPHLRVCVRYPSVCPVMKAVSMITNPTISTSRLNDRGIFTLPVVRREEGGKKEWEREEGCSLLLQYSAKYNIAGLISITGWFETFKNQDYGLGKLQKIKEFTRFKKKK